MLAEMKDHTFRLGHVETDTLASMLTSESYLELMASTMTECMPMCADCGVQPYCGSDPVYHYATQGDAIGLKPGSGFCHKNMEIIRHLVLLWRTARKPPHPHVLDRLAMKQIATLLHAPIKTLLKSDR